MVFGDVEHHPGLGSHRRRPVQLEAGQLDGQQVGGLIATRPAPGYRCCRTTGCAACGDEHGMQHRRGGGLAVGAGDRQPAARRPVMAGGVEPPRQLDVAPDRHTGRRRGDRHRRGRRETGAGDHQGVVGDVVRRRSPNPPSPPRPRRTAAGWPDRRRTALPSPPALRSAASTARPVTPPPATSTGDAADNGSSAGSRLISAAAGGGEPLAVEQRHPQAAADRGE